MQKLSLILFLGFFSISTYSQDLTGRQLLEQAIQFHDPKGNWSTFKGTLMVTMETPKSPKRVSKIQIDLFNEYFQVIARQGKNTTGYTVNKEKCSIDFNGKRPTEEEKKSFNLSCDRANLYKNYYTYLYGLPMKLKDKGTLLHKIVEKRKFKGKEYLVLKVSYRKGVGNDTWFFYFNPDTYALEVYQFLKNGKEGTGEYILLSGIETINGIKMPKIRAWYYNKDDKYLGTDILNSSSKVD